jgi:hypothetical protein
MSQYSSTVSTISKDLIIQESKILKDVFASHGLKNIRYSLKNMDDEDKT